MRIPQLYDYVYHRQYDKSVFQVIGMNHNPNEKHPTLTLLNIPTLKDANILCPLECEMVEIFGIPISDIEFHFNEGRDWFFDNECELLDDSQTTVTIGDYYSAETKNDKWQMVFDGYDPEPVEIEYIHELQQHFRGMTGKELFEKKEAMIP